MPFAFGQVDPRDTGEVSQMDVPLGTYIGAAAEEGFSNSVGSTIYRAEEQHLEQIDPDGTTIQPDEANKRFGLPGLTFDEPVKTGVAELLQQRHQAEMNRQFLLDQGNTSLGRGIAGMGTQMASSMLNPVDLGMLFLPIVGEEGAATTLMRGPIREAIGRGIFTSADVAEAFPKTPNFAKSVIQGLGYQSMAEIPQQIQARRELQDPGDPLEHIATAGLFAGGMHLVLDNMAKFLMKLAPGTQDAMFQKAMDDFAKGREIDVTDQVKLDPALAQEQAFQSEQAKEQFAAKQYDELNQPGGDLPRGAPAVPETPPEEPRQYTSQLDEIRQRGAKTTAQVQALFLDNEGNQFLSREDAADLRRQAWGTSDIGYKPPQQAVDDAHWDNIQSVIAKAREQGDRDPIRAADNAKMSQDGKTLTQPQVEEAKMPANVPEPADVSAVKDQAQQSIQEIKQRLNVPDEEPAEDLQKQLEEEMGEIKPQPEVIKDATGCILRKEL